MKHIQTIVGYSVALILLMAAGGLFMGGWEMVSTDNPWLVLGGFAVMIPALWSALASYVVVVAVLNAKD